jgi:hypothetical protein
MVSSYALRRITFSAPDICVREPSESTFSEEIIQIRREGPGDLALQLGALQ